MGHGPVLETMEPAAILHNVAGEIGYARKETEKKMAGGGWSSRWPLFRWEGRVSPGP